MRFSGLHHRHTSRHTASGLCVRARAWVGLLLALLLLSTLAPVISRTLDHGKPLAERGWVEVCSASGVLWMRVDGGAKSPAAPTGQPGTMADASAHCPWCPMQGAAGLPPESALATTASVQGPVPTAAFTSACPVLLWSKAQSRAPPAA